MNLMEFIVNHYGLIILITNRDSDTKHQTQHRTAALRRYVMSLSVQNYRYSIPDRASGQ